MSKPFDYIEDLNFKKQDLSRNGEDGIAGYNPWLTNKHFGMFIDTVLYANEVNSMHRLDKQLQHDYYLHSVRPKKRWAKWAKPAEKDAVAAISEWYQINSKKAREVMRVLPKSDIEDIIRRMQADERDRPGGGKT